MKIAITGKGGVGKTTLAALMARTLAQKGRRVLAIDADADANFAAALGIDISAHEIQPIAAIESLIEEKMGTGPEQGEGLYTLNPFVGDIPERFSIHHKGVDFLAVGTVIKGGAGCYCAENKLLKRLLHHLVVQREEAVIIDMEAGLEHLSRGTAKGIDAFIVVVEPGQRSLETAVNVQKMAHEIGVEAIYVIANKIHSEDEIQMIQEYLKGMELLCVLPYDPAIAGADLKGLSPADVVNEEMLSLLEVILKRSACLR